MGNFFLNRKKKKKEKKQRRQQQQRRRQRKKQVGDSCDEKNKNDYYHGDENNDDGSISITDFADTRQYDSSATTTKEEKTSTNTEQNQKGRRKKMPNFSKLRLRRKSSNEAATTTGANAGATTMTSSGPSLNDIRGMDSSNPTGNNLPTATKVEAIVPGTPDATLVMTMSSMSRSVTELPIMEHTTGKPRLDVTKIPTTTSSDVGARTATAATSGVAQNLYHQHYQHEPQQHQQRQPSGMVQNHHQQQNQQQKQPRTDASGTRLAMTGAQVAKDESRLKKILIRTVSGAGMISVFFGCIYMGHLYVCFLIALLEVMLFRELVKVRYNAHFHTIAGTIPLFRTTQWMWFCVAIAYAYGDFLVEVIQNNSQFHHLWPYSQYFSTFSFGLYSATFVTTIATMQSGHIKFQLNQLCWTIVVLCLTVGQMKYIMHNIFNGFFWFTFPFLLVVVNDVMAYFSGMTCGRKFIRRKFISFSPNKTWEGFIGGGIFTMISAWYLSRFLAQYSWMTCPTNEFRWIPKPLECENHHVFQEAVSVVPAQVFELLPKSFVKNIPGIVEYCSVREVIELMDGSTVTQTLPELTRCVSGEATHVFHHFELALKNVYPIQKHALWLGLFASLVAPFGGFLASAIKRAYGIKDFDSLIPGHGGVTDRLDCQFLMALCTWVHYNTFVKMATVSVPKLVYMFQMLDKTEQQAFIEEIVAASSGAGNRNGIRDLAFEDYAF